MTEPDKNSASTGTLYLVATPIGNLEDITLRAIKTLQEVDIIAAEDTRHTRNLLSHLNIKKSIVSFREHNKAPQARRLVSRLQEGQNIALCSDAGMPLISDPGDEIVHLCIEENIPVTVIPGANAALCALILSGLSAENFLFLGFITRKTNKRKEFFQTLAQEPYTLIFYESPNRVIDFLTDARETLGNRRACAVREITKIHEEAIRGNISQIIDSLHSKDAIKGEFTIVIEGMAQNNAPIEFEPDNIAREAQKMIEEGEEKKQAFKKLAAKYNKSKSQIYSIYLAFEKKSDL